MRDKQQKQEKSEAKCMIILVILFFMISLVLDLLSYFKTTDKKLMACKINGDLVTVRKFIFYRILVNAPVVLVQVVSIIMIYVEKRWKYMKVVNFVVLTITHVIFLVIGF